MDHNLRIPLDRRESFSEPLDILIAGTREETLIQVENIIKDYLELGASVNFFIVGDIVTKDFLSNEFLRSFIKICIEDVSKGIIGFCMGSLEQSDHTLKIPGIGKYLGELMAIYILTEYQRKHIGLDHEDFFEQTVELKNPEGTIQKGCWNLLREIIESEKKTLIKITEGEEDLLVLPLVLEVPIKEGFKNFAFYGQPPITDSKFMIPEGIVIVDVNRGVKEKVKKVISLMDKF